ncbi:MAG: gamma carbonic anhydrase family protein [Solirubrobacteraceae bacterium]|jgi:carbonic anhydrase/acetyltransferase-like protein (isoleucine patch superfamily)
MGMLIELDGVAPTIGADVWLAPTAVLVGDVRVGDRANIWFGAVLRGDSSRIEIGEESSIQDNVVIHCAKGLPTVVGARVTVGHGALLEGCVIEDEALVGMGSIVLQHARVGSGAMIAAGTVVPERAEIRPGTLGAGVPAQEKKQLSGAALNWTRTAAQEYQQYRKRYLTTSRVRASE